MAVATATTTDTLRTAIDTLQALVQDLEQAAPERRHRIPLAHRYLHSVVNDPARIICLEICGMRFTDTHTTQHHTADPEFYSVFVRMCNANNDALAYPVGDFVEVEAACDYARHIASLATAPIDIHLLVDDGWELVEA